MKNLENNVAISLFENTEEISVLTNSEIEKVEEEKKMADTIKIYTDGSCLKNPGKGGWAYVYADGSKEESGSSTKLTTNNVMELTAIGYAIKSTPEGSNVEIITDSEYAINTITGKWQRNKNSALLSRIDELIKNHTVKFTWVKGHSGDVMNERCDKLAKTAANKNVTDENSEEENSMKKKNPVEIKKFELALKKALLGFTMRIAHSITGTTYKDPAKNYERAAAKIIGIKPVDFKAFMDTDATKKDAEKYYRNYFEEILSAQTAEETGDETSNVENDDIGDENISTDEKNSDVKDIPAAEKKVDPIVIPHEEVNEVVNKKQLDDSIVEITDIDSDQSVIDACEEAVKKDDATISFVNLNTKRTINVVVTAVKKYNIKKFLLSDNADSTEQWKNFVDKISKVGVTITETAA